MSSVAVLSVAPAPSRTTGPAPTAGGRLHLPALDGLRAIAVVLVVAYHALPEQVPGGFVGVDMFFVLSGFLITGLLLRERAEHGRVRLRNFWVRRARRLLPALVTMLAVCSAATVLIGHGTASGLRSQVLGALTWTSNWVQLHEGWAYADAQLPPIFNHLWSLGIEEQFYVLWPLVLAAGCAVLGRRRTAGAVLVLAGVSFALMAMWSSGGEPNRAYLGLDSHAGGLLVGAALALVAGRLTGWAARDSRAEQRATALGVIGLAGIAAFAATIDWGADATYLGGLALASVATVGAIVGAVVSPRLAAVLGTTPLRWLGERSYGWYLWHWPLIVAATRLAPDERAEAAACGAALAALVAAALSYRYVEMPMRRDGVRATCGRWIRTLRTDRSRRPRLIATTGAVCVIFAGAALAQAPAESEVARTLRAGERVAVGSAAELDVPAEPAPPQTPAPCAAVPPQAPVSAFGDSVTVAIAPVLAGRRPGSTAVATVGWQYADVAAAVRQAAAAGQLQPTVVITTGTNGEVDQADLDVLVSRDLAGHRIALVVPFVPGHAWSDQATGAVHGVAAAHPEIELVDWAGVAAGRPDLLHADRVHPNAAGQGVFVDLVGQAFATC